MRICSKYFRRLKAASHAFLSMSLLKKVFLLCALSGFLPLALNFTVTYGKMRESYLDNQLRVTEQRLLQVQSAVTVKLSKIYQSSIGIVTNYSIADSLSRVKNESGSQSLYRIYDSLSYYLRQMGYSENYDRITFFINRDFSDPQGVEFFFRPFESSDGITLKGNLEYHRGKATWSAIPAMPNGQTYRTGGTLVLSRYIVNINNDYSEILSMVAMGIELDERNLNDLFSYAMPGQIVYLKTTRNVFLIGNGGETEPVLASTDIEDSLTQSLRQVKIVGKDYLACVRALPDLNLKLYSFTPVNALDNYLLGTGGILIISFICACILMFIMIYFVIRSAFKRIRLLSDKVGQVQAGSLEMLDIPDRHDEIGELIMNYNFMVKEIETLLNKQFELGQENKNIELMALQSQINPHFLYNTLDMINWMAKKNETGNIQDTIFALAKYYKLILNKGEDILTIEKELDLCDAYISIQQSRFKGQIRFIVDVDEQFRKYLIPKITLQPLIENAIIHGIMEKPGGRGTITVSAEDSEEYIVLSVTDDGVGMYGDTPKGSSYGVSNIEKRLTLFYNMMQCVSFQSTEGIGTCVRLRIRKITAS